MKSEKFATAGMVFSGIFSNFALDITMLNDV
jgi:hypothetical protein